MVLQNPSDDFVDIEDFSHPMGDRLIQKPATREINHRDSSSENSDKWIIPNEEQALIEKSKQSLRSCLNFIFQNDYDVFLFRRLVQVKPGRRI